MFPPAVKQVYYHYDQTLKAFILLFSKQGRKERARKKKKKKDLLIWIHKKWEVKICARRVDSN